jgi:tRNA threonylcarbamoyladenosine modification (KEOPS) complex Cgi121 subunit
MLKQLEKFDVFLEISGFQNVKLADPRAFLAQASQDLPVGVEVQLFDANVVATWQHLYFAALNALSAIRAGNSLSKSVAVESALYASAQRQIKKAIEAAGVQAETINVAILVIGKDANAVTLAARLIGQRLGAQADDSALDLTSEKKIRLRQLFDITDAELSVSLELPGNEQTFIAAVIERVALLATRL